MATNGNFNHQSQYKGSTDQPTASSTTPESSATHIYNNQHDPGSVGWFFVEQYYTTLSSSPERLHLFYSKRSQFVYGVEAEVANVSVGRSAIQERIKALEFSDCKVRVSNVDTQQSFDNILIQVIGEISNKTAEPKKFVQTFVLAQQPHGYFVLNDIFRYIIDEGDDEPVEAAAPQEVVSEAEPEVLNEVEAPVDQAAPELEESALENAPAHLDATVIDKKLEEVSAVTKDSSPSATGTPVEPVTEAQDAVAVAPDAAAEGLPDPDKTARELAEEDAKKEEAPKDPTPTPVVARVSTPVAAEPEKPKEPPKPMSWANRVAAAAGAAAAPRPIVPLPKTSTPPAAAQSRPPPTAAPPASGAATQSLESPVGASKPARDSTSEWQTASANSRRQNHPGSISSPPVEKDMTMGYIRNVTDKIQTEDLRAALSKYGELVYFDVNRGKNCAFVEFTTHAGYLAATGANPHIVNGEEINVEPRRPKANAYGGSNYDRGRGGASGGRGRGGYDGPRSGSGSQGGGRGTFGSLGRGGGRGGGPTSRGGRGGISQPGNV